MRAIESIAEFEVTMECPSKYSSRGWLNESVAQERGLGWGSLLFNPPGVLEAVQLCQFSSPPRFTLSACFQRLELGLRKPHLGFASCRLCPQREAAGLEGGGARPLQTASFT